MQIEDYRTGVRLYLRDMAELNRLLHFEEENANEYIDLYINMALGFMNSIPPQVVMYNIATFPYPALLIHQSAIEALTSNSILQARNELTYNNGGVSVKVADAQRYLPALQQLYTMTNREIDFYRNMKVAANIDACWGGVNSPYQYIAGYPYLIRPYNGLES